MTGFSKLHPFVEFFFFLLVMAVSMFVSHPALQLLGFFLAALTALSCVGVKKFLRQLLLVMPLMLFTAILNPLITHQGVTVLFYFPSGNACTLESVLYGVFAAVRLATVLFWFVGWNAVITSDKFVFLFGRVIPALSLTISMGLRLIPRLLRRIREVSEAQKCLCPDSKGLRHAGRVISIVITWSLENALDTADSMKSRGYGLPKRSAFSLYRFTARDGVALAYLTVLGASVLLAALTGQLTWQFYPMLQGSSGAQTALSAAVFTLLAAFPVMYEAKEAVQWRISRSRT